MKAQTQWRIGYGGPTGLDYGAVEVLMRIADVKDKMSVFDGIQTMEFAALKIMAEKG